MAHRWLWLFAFVFMAAAPCSAFAEEKPDDSVAFDLSAEDWVVAKAARVLLSVEAAVNASNEGSMRADMIKAVGNAVKADWRMTAFNRAQDQTGMERWSVIFEARVPEASLSGLANAVKKASKPGMQIKVDTVDFSPSLEEMEAARAALRTRIVKSANEQLASLNAALPGRNFRISSLTFNNNMAVPVPMPMFRTMAAKRAMSEAVMSAPAMAGGEDVASSTDVSQKLTLTAQVLYAALPSAGTTSPAAR